LIQPLQTMKDCTLEQKVKNAQKRILEFDDQIDGPSKLRLFQATVGNTNEVLRRSVLKARRYLIMKRGEMVNFLLQHDVPIPTRGI